MEDDILLKNGSVATDPRLGRIVQFDERSRSFDIKSIFAPDHVEPRSYRWRCLQWLDQLDTPACVGFSWSHELIARPKEVKGIDDQSALNLYYAAQMMDEWPGTEYEGTSVLAGAKEVKDQGHMDEYRWAFTTKDLAIAVSYHGPAVLGINWYTGMFTPAMDGSISPEGELAGGHAILCRGYSTKLDAFLLRNSWGVSWGISGDCWISFANLDRLLHESGEACIPVLRK